MTAVAMTTTTVPDPTGARPERVTPGRPDDEDSVRVLLAWAAGTVWPDSGDHPPLLIDFMAARYWWTASLQQPPEPGRGLAYSPTVYPGGDMSHDEFAGGNFAALLLAAATAGVCAALGPAPSWEAGPMQRPSEDNACFPPMFYVDGAHVEVGSWSVLEDDGYDGADLWRWAAADRAAADGRRTAKERDQAMTAAWPNALLTAQAIHDALQLLHGEARPTTEPPPPAPTYRRNQWR